MSTGPFYVLAVRVSALGGQGELRVACAVHPGVQHHVVELLRSRLVEVDRGAVLLDDLVAVLRAGGRGDTEGGFRTVVTGDPESRCFCLLRDRLHDGRGVLGELEDRKSTRLNSRQ